MSLPPPPRAARLLPGCVISVLLIGSIGCTPQIVRSTPPPTPSSAVEMAEDTERLDMLIGSGQLRKEELRKNRDAYQALVEQLRGRANPEDAFVTLSLKRSERTLKLYEDLLALAEEKPPTRAERATAAARTNAILRDYLRDVAELEQSIELLPAEEKLPSAIGAKPLEVVQLPPPSASRLLSAYRAGQYEAVVREVEAAGPEALAKMEAAAVTAYALALGGQRRFEDALKAAAPVMDTPLASQEELELRYRQALWLARVGRKDEAVLRLQQLQQEVQTTATRASDYRTTVKLTLDEVSRGSAKFLEQVLEARFALEDERFEDARAMARQMLEKESSASAVERLEKLLLEIDTSEERAFSQRIAEILAMSRIEGGAGPAQEALEQLATQFGSAKFKPRIDEARQAVAEAKRRAEGVSGGGPGTGTPAAVAADGAGTATKTSGSAAAPAAPGGVSSGPGGTTPTAATSGTGAITGSATPPGPAGAGATGTGNASPGSVAGVTGTGAGNVTPASTASMTATGAGNGTPAGSAGVTAGGAGSATPTSTTSASATGAGNATPAGNAGVTAGGTGGAMATPPSGTASTTSGGGASSTKLAGPDAASAASSVGTPEQQKQLAQARQLSKMGNYEEAIRSFTRLQGTPLEAEAKADRQKAVDAYVQRVREQVAKEYVRAQQLKAKEDRTKLLNELDARLREVLTSYPETSLRAKVEHNITVIEAELRKLDPTWSPTTPSGSAGTGPSGASN